MSCDHQYLVSLKGYCPSKGALVYEFMEGGNLQQFIESPEMRARYGFRRRVSWLLQIASGMAFLHNGSETPIRHWDVKPANVVLDADHNTLAGAAQLGCGLAGGLRPSCCLRFLISGKSKWLLQSAS